MTFYNLERVCHGSLYGPMIGWNKVDVMGRGFRLSNDLTVFAAYNDRYFKMVGVQENGDQEARYDTFEGLQFSLNDVKQAWESGTKAGANYLVKDISGCSIGIKRCSGKLHKLKISIPISIANIQLHNPM